VSEVAEIREWAKSQGILISDRGRIPHNIHDAWIVAHGGVAPERPPRKSSADYVRGKENDPAVVSLNWVKRHTNLILAVKEADALLGMYEHSRDPKFFDQARHVLQVATAPRHKPRNPRGLPKSDPKATPYTASLEQVIAIARSGFSQLQGEA
jgi:hypothetical protein